MKKMIMCLLTAMLLTASAGAVDLYVDMAKIETDTPPTLVGGRTVVPLRAIFEAIGANVEWDNDTRTATGTRDNTTVVIQIDNPTAYINSEARTLDVPAQLINGRTMVPARFISEAMGCDVTWYDTTKTAAVANTLKGQNFYVTKTGEHYHYSSTCNGGIYYEATLAEAVGRGLTACDKCVLTGENSAEPPSWLSPSDSISQPTPAPQPDSPAQPAPGNSNSSSGGNSGNADNFNTYDNSDQQKTEAKRVLNTSSMKIHYPSCSQVKKIAPHNYATSNASEAELLAQGYTTCGVCHK